MLPEEFERLGRLASEATPGPWSAADEHGLMPGATPAWCVSRMDGEKWLYDVFYHASQSDPAQSERDSEFIAAARTALPSLLARLRAAEETLAIVREWAFTKHGGVKTPAEVWPGLAAALAEGASR